MLKHTLILQFWTRGRSVRALPLTRIICFLACQLECKLRTLKVLKCFVNATMIGHNPVDLLPQWWRFIVVSVVFTFIAQLISGYSLPRARDRLAAAQERLQTPEPTRNAERQQLQKDLRALGLHASQVGDTRPVSHCAFSPNGRVLATASWSGLCKLWTVPDCRLDRTLRGHTCNVGAVAWHPSATIGVQPSDVNLASCGHDGTVKLWSLDR